MIKLILSYTKKVFQKEKVITTYTLLNKQKKILLMVFYIDNLSFIRNYQNFVIQFKYQLISKFDMSKLGEGDMTLYLKAKCIKLLGSIFMT